MESAAVTAGPAAAVSAVPPVFSSLVVVGNWGGVLDFLERFRELFRNLVEVSLLDSSLEEASDGAQVGIVLFGHQGNGFPGFSRARRPPDAVDIVIELVRNLVVVDVRDEVDVQSPPDR